MKTEFAPEILARIKARIAVGTPCQTSDEILMVAIGAIADEIAATGEEAFFNDVDPPVIDSDVVVELWNYGTGREVERHEHKDGPGLGEKLDGQP